jgi:hypothetical protein
VGVVAQMSGNADDRTLFVYLYSNNEDVESVVDMYYDLEILDNFPRDYSDKVPNDEFIFATNDED